jgi:predicted ATPase
MVLNEPETSLHPDLLPALARLIVAASEQSQLIVVSHARILIESLSEAPQCKQLNLEKSFGETIFADATLFNRPTWQWPSR